MIANLATSQNWEKKKQKKKPACDKTCEIAT
jgi:hypothetical protein